jgi:hypothetical protein
MVPDLGDMWPDCVRVCLARLSQASASLSRRALSAGEAVRRASSTETMAFLLYSYSFLIMGATRVSRSPRHPQTRLMTMGSRNLKKNRTWPVLAAGDSGSTKKKAPRKRGIGVQTAGPVDIQPKCAKSVPTYARPGVPFRTWQPALLRQDSSRVHSIPRRAASWSRGLVCLRSSMARAQGAWKL